MTNRTLNDYCEFIVDCLHKTAPIEETETDFYSIRTPDIGRGRLNIEAANRVSEDTYKKWTVRGVPQAGDLILAREAPVGNIGIVPKNVKVCCGQRTVHIRPDKSKIVPDYLVYLMNGDEIQGKIQGYSQGATVAHLNMEDIRALVLPELPTMPTQRRIADILSAYDDLIENNTRRIRILEGMAQAIYQEWFGKVDNESLPKGWKISDLFTVAEVNYGKNLPTKKLKADGLYPVYGAAKIIGRHDEYSRENRTIITGCRGSVGEMQITQPKCFVTNNSFTFDVKLDYDFFWLFYSLKNRGLKDVVGGAAQPQITLDGISSVELAVPPSELRMAFQNYVSGLYSLIWNLEDKNINLRQTRDLLLPRLVSGEIDVSTLS